MVKVDLPQPEERIVLHLLLHARLDPDLAIRIALDLHVLGVVEAQVVGIAIGSSSCRAVLPVELEECSNGPQALQESRCLRQQCLHLARTRCGLLNLLVISNGIRGNLLRLSVHVLLPFLSSRALVILLLEGLDMLISLTFHPCRRALLLGVFCRGAAKAPTFLLQASPFMLEPAFLPLPAAVFRPPEPANSFFLLAIALGLSSPFVRLLLKDRGHCLDLGGRGVGLDLILGLDFADGQCLCLSCQHIREVQHGFQRRSHVHPQRRPSSRGPECCLVRCLDNLFDQTSCPKPPEAKSNPGSQSQVPELVEDFSAIP